MTASNNHVCLFCGSEIDKETVAFHSNATENDICKNCILMCHQAMTKKKRENRIIKKIMTPKEIKEELDKNIIGQDDAKRAIAIAVYNHYKRMDILTDVKISKSNVLLLGPTGSGKTLIAQTIAELLDVPFAIADATSLTEAGFVGDDVESILLKLIQAADGDIEKAERGIIFLDEVDKLAKTNVGTNITKDPSGEGTQQALLKILEGTLANVPPTGGRKNPNEKCIPFNTENVLFICGGAFPGMEDIVNKRVNKESQTSIGFGANTEKAEVLSVGNALKEVSTEDLVAYGFIPEFIGRLPIIVSLDELNEDALIEILTKPKNSIVNQYKELFKYDGVDLVFTPEALEEMAKDAIKNKTGARGLRGILEKRLKDVMFSIPSNPDIEKCIIDKDGKTSMKRSRNKKIAC